MKILLIRPFIDSTVGISPPLSLMYLSSFLKSKKIEVKLIDKCIERDNAAKDHFNNMFMKGGLLDEIRRDNPDIIGMTLYSRELNDIAVLCRVIKNYFKSSYIVLGGPHPTVMPDETMEQIPECDFIVRGEGELTLYDLIRNICDHTPLRTVKGVSFRDRETKKVFHCEDRDIAADIDSFPFPDREGLLENYQNNKYGSFLYGVPSDIIITSRGCPYQCSFCFKVCKKYRSRSPGNVIEEIEWIIKNISPKSIQIVDDSFTIEKERAAKILSYLIQNRQPCKFKVRSRVDAVDEGLLNKMKKAGIDTIVYGFESGAQKMLDLFNKQTTVEQNIEACRLTKKAGINCFGDMILFYPGEDRTTIQETKQFLKTARPAGVKFYILSPLPGTKVYDEAKRRGVLINDWAVGRETPWIKLREFRDLDEMERIAKKISLQALLNPASILYMLKTLIRNFLKNPCLCLRLMIYSIIKRYKY